jgi:hypothetical protein
VGVGSASRSETGEPEPEADGDAVYCCCCLAIKSERPDSCGLVEDLPFDFECACGRRAGADATDVVSERRVDVESASSALEVSPPSSSELGTDEVKVEAASEAGRVGGVGKTKECWCRTCGRSWCAADEDGEGGGIFPVAVAAGVSAAERVSGACSGIAGGAGVGIDPSGGLEKGDCADVLASCELGLANRDGDEPGPRPGPETDAESGSTESCIVLARMSAEDVGVARGR